MKKNLRLALVMIVCLFTVMVMNAFRENGTKDRAVSQNHEVYLGAKLP